MDTHLHRHVMAGAAAIGLCAAVAVPTAVPAAASTESPPVSSAPAPAALSPPGLIGQQVAFHVAFVTDFLSTGAELFARELPIPLELAADIGGGTPLPTAVSRALQDFLAVEVDAGAALVQFGAEYVAFQAGFVTSLLPAPPAAVPAVLPASPVPASPVRALDVASVARIVTPTNATPAVATGHRGPPLTSTSPLAGAERRHELPDVDGLRHRTDMTTPARTSASPSTPSTDKQGAKHDRGQHDRHVDEHRGHRS